MKVSKITLLKYRNYDTETVSFGENVNVIFGDNAQGKTNLLESIFLFSSGKSHRGAGDRELIKNGEEEAKIKLSYFSKEREEESEIFISQGHRKEIFRNGIKMNRKKDWLGKFESVLFYPEELLLIKEGPEIRRKYFDQAISLRRPVYDHYLSLYATVLKQKNNLLRKIEENEKLKTTLPVWNERMAEIGARIIFYRQSFIKKLAPLAEKFMQEITDGKEHISLSYETPFLYEETEKIKEAFLKKLKEIENTEMAAKQSLVGPHRDDIKFTINGLSAKNYASQGQQRSIVLALKLAESEMIFEESGSYPVLLFDDILSELDQKRRAYLLQKMKGKQVIITCTDKEQVPEESDVTYFRAKEGKIETCI